MMTGSHGRIENGVTRVYRAGAVLKLDDWEADARFEPSIEQEMAATQSSDSMSGSAGSFKAQG